MSKTRRRAGFLFPLLPVVLAFPGSCRTPLDPAPAERASMEVRQVLNLQLEAWNSGDLEVFMQTYWESPDLSFVSGGSLYRGWQATLERYRNVYGENRKDMGKLRFSNIEVQLLESEVALATGEFVLERNGFDPLTGRFTLVLKKLEEGWRIIHDHTSS